MLINITFPLLSIQTFGGAGCAADDDGFTWTEGPVMCMLATRAGPGHFITLYAVTADKRLIISSYPARRYANFCIYIGGRLFFIVWL